MGGVIRPKPSVPAEAIMKNFSTYKVVKLDDQINAQEIELTEEQWQGCMKLLYALNRAGFDLSLLQIF